MNDPVVITSLRNRGVNLSDYAEILKYEAVERMPRTLDKAPKRLNLQKASEIQVYGCRSEFLMMFNDIKENTTLEQAVIDLKGNKRFCDVSVYIALLALIQSGFSYSAERASACFDVFKVIIMAPGDTLTTKRVYDALAAYTPSGYYAEELVKALNVCLFDEKPSVLHWLSLCEFNGFYPLAMELGKDVIRRNCAEEKDVEKFLRPLYKQAREDEEFISQLYKPAANKWLVPMLYYLHKNHPEVMEPGNKGGFA